MYGVWGMRKLIMIIATHLDTLLLWVILPSRNLKKHALVDAFLLYFAEK